MRPDLYDSFAVISSSFGEVLCICLFLMKLSVAVSLRGVFYLLLLILNLFLRVIYDIHIIVQSFKEWILRTIEETWNLFHKKFIALWDEHKDGSGEAYLPAIYNNPELQRLVQKKFMEDLFHDTLGFGAAKMIR